MKLAVVVGHMQVSPGAFAIEPISQYEYHFNKRLAYQMRDHAVSLGKQCQVFLRDQGGLAGAYNGLNKWQPDCAIELHFNAANGKARGTCALYGAKNPKSALLAGIVQNEMVRLFERPPKEDRGSILLKQTDRGYFNVNQANCPSVLIEPFFGDEPNDAKLAYEKKDIIAAVLIESLISFVGSTGVVNNVQNHSKG